MIKPARRSSYLLPGLVLLFVGVGIFIALGAIAGEHVRMLGLIPAGVGLALLIYHFVEGASSRWPGRTSCRPLEPPDSAGRRRAKMSAFPRPRSARPCCVPRPPLRLP